ncbi:MAG: homoserine kinase [Anaerolineae bacterium]|nr:homoserine kinase [Anaerolineae bacterium]
MAVKTEFSLRDIDAILSHYDLGVCTGHEAIPQGTVQTNYAISTPQGEFVLRYYENRSWESVMFESDVLTYLTGHGYPCPNPREDRLGSYVGIHNDKPYILFDFIEGSPVEHPTWQQREQLIHKAAELQLITSDFQSIYTPYRWNYTPALCRALAKEQAIAGNSQAVWDKFSWLEAQLGNLDLPDDLPRGVCHCDFHFSNVLYMDGDLTALLDFDDANITYLQFDLVGLIEYGAWPYTSDSLDLHAARDIVCTYTEIRPLSTLEKRHFIDVYKLSILFDCVWYFARDTGDDFYEKQKIDYLSRQGRHSLTQALFESGG